MKISTKGRYAVRILVDLAENQKGQYVSLKEVSARQGVSDKYSEQIMNLLNKAGIVKSTRGSKGGYMLNLAAEEITVGAVLRLAEGSLAPVPCLDGSCNTCERAKKCVTVEVWEKINVAVNSIVDGISIADLVKRQAELNEMEDIGNQ